MANAFGLVAFGLVAIGLARCTGLASLALRDYERVGLLSTAAD